MSEVYPEDESMEKLNMGAYYYGFEETGVREIDEILSEVACAGKGAHSTEFWCEYGYPEKIQAAANRAATLLAKVERLERENERMREALELLCYSVAGTEGTKTNSELPEWLRLRFKDAISALSEIEK